MNKKVIDINCDLGEGLDNEALVMPYISSCNIACGAHAGSIEIIDKVIRLAKQHLVKIGAHPSYPDRENFGRKKMDISNGDLQKSIENQLLLMQERVALQNTQLHHIKLHGALYNVSAVNKEIAQVAVNAIKNTIQNTAIYAPFNSIFSHLAEKAGYKILYEVFADRNYNDDASLVSRQFSNAVLHQKEKVFEHVLKMLQEQKVSTVSGKEIPVKADTFCIHGDHKNAVEILQYLQKKLKEMNIEIG